jgi:excinuclease ABC subunit C
MKETPKFFRWVKLKKPSDIPDFPGVYTFYDKNDLPIYIGKAKSLKKRLLSYWNKLDSKEGKILENSNSLDYIVTDNENEAIILEGNLIKQYKPRFNVNLKDDKTFPYIKITNETFPRIYFTRNKKNDGSKYYGPYTSLNLIRKSLHKLKGVFGIRDCNSKLEPHPSNKPCLNYQIKRCTGPCSLNISESDYNNNVKAVENYLKRNNMNEYIEIIEDRLRDSIDNKDFEEASILRDSLISLKALIEEQKVEMGVVDDDIINFSIKDNLGVITVFTMREGRMIGRETYTM